jgi:hypothetical protein
MSFRTSCRPLLPIRPPPLASTLALGAMQEYEKVLFPAVRPPPPRSSELRPNHPLELAPEVLVRVLFALRERRDVVSQGASGPILSSILAGRDRPLTGRTQQSTVRRRQQVRGPRVECPTSVTGSFDEVLHPTLWGVRSRLEHPHGTRSNLSRNRNRLPLAPAHVVAVHEVDSPLSELEARFLDRASACTGDTSAAA